MIRNLVLILILFASMVTAREADSTSVNSPKKAALRAFLFPGWGQAYNGKYLKAGVICAAEAAAIWRFSENRRMYDTYSTDYALPQHRYLEKRNKYAWWIFFTYVYGILDAVVDAHLGQFDEIMSEDLEAVEIKNKPNENSP